MTRDIENDGFQINYVAGYASLAEFIASDPDHGTAIYRRFDELSARNLLYMQSELAELKAEQEALDEEDWRGGLEDKIRARDWKVLQESAKSGNVKDARRVELVKNIRTKLKEYQEALLLESTMLSFRRPTRQAFEAFKEDFNTSDNSGTPHSTLLGNSASLYNDREDLAALRRPAEEDRLTMVLRQYVPFLFATKGRRRGQVAQYSAARIRATTAFVSTFFAAALLYGAILNFYFITSDRAKLGLIAAYTTAFALCVVLVTNAKRSEIFAACAAYAAVIVVFVSGNLGNSNSSGGGSGSSQGGIG